MDHSIGLLSDATVAHIPKDAMLALVDRRPRLTRALWWGTLVDEAVLREWLVNMGQRNAHDRIAHLFVELWFRLRLVGRVEGDAFDLSLTQEELGDTMGLTAVHVNRVLQRMREEELFELRRGRIHIPDVQALMRVSRFDPNYLHLQRRVG
jgi:CRP-like cAMP-binding protein